MPDATAMLTAALALHRSGQWSQAESLYEQVLAQDPSNVDAWHLLGMLAHQRGELAIAESKIRRALALKPDFADAHNNLGNVLKDQGRLEESLSCYRRAAELNPNLPEAQVNLGNHHQQAGQPAEAIAHYQRALAANPDHIEARSNLGAVFQAVNRLDEAIDCYRQALRLAPDNRDARCNLATALQTKGAYAEAITEYRQTLAQHPEFPEAWFNLGNAYRESDRYDEAIDCYNRALELKPDYAKALTNLGVVHFIQQRAQEAIACCRRSLALDPQSVETHLMLAFGWLLTGQFQQGWPEYEWRRQSANNIIPKFAQPAWRGEPLENRTILLHYEQGLGDTFQFLRYAPLIKSLGARVIVRCQPRLSPLLARSPGIDHIVEPDQPLPDFDVHAPLLSLPLSLGTTLDSIPSEVPYIFADPQLIEKWRHRLPELHASHYSRLPTPDSLPFRIGINWQGHSPKGMFGVRDIPLQQFTRLSSISGVSLINLQRGRGREELQNLANPTAILDPGEDVDVAAGSFMDTAAIMKNLDLVITSDTAIAHLAGALGINVWVALPFAPEWRWLLSRTDSPWYPTMRLFRQPKHGAWTTVFDQITAELQKITTPQPPAA